MEYKDLINQLFTLNGLLLLLGGILLFVLIGLVINRRTRLNRSVIAPRIMILPTAFIYLTCRILLNLSRDHLSVKSTETILIIFTIAFIINLINHLFLEMTILSREKKRFQN